ncbi:MAG: HAD family hydrolase, partial [Candidatus Yonathbacteria bacterium]|nr:HAD family hydrolase [Candidatus Yonathbacteria bacterium]
INSGGESRPLRQVAFGFDRRFIEVAMLQDTIKHIWFDFSETIAFLKKGRHDRLRYETYAQVTGKPVTEELIAEYENLYKKFNHSNAAIFRSLGQTSNFWSERVNSVEPSELYELADENVPKVLQKVKETVPISIFSNIELGKILMALSINPEWFTHIISAGMVKEPKPALDGFYKIIELSGIPAQEILYIGDDVGKDVRPAKQVGVQAGLMWKKSDEADYSFENFKSILEIC